MKKGNSSKGSKRVQGKGKKIEEKKMTDEKKQAIKKEVRKDVDEILIGKLMEETKKKLTALATDIVMVPRNNTVGWKIVDGKKLIAMAERKNAFMMWIYEYNKTGYRINIADFKIKSASADSEKVVTGLIAQVKKNADVLRASMIKEKADEIEAKKVATAKRAEAKKANGSELRKDLAKKVATAVAKKVEPKKEAAPAV